jgi:putative transposase
LYSVVPGGVIRRVSRKVGQLQALAGKLLARSPRLPLTCPLRLIQLEVSSGPSEDQGMKRNRFSEDQIIAILKEHEAGVAVAELCRKHGVSDASIYKWKAKYGGMDVSEAKRLKSLEDENTRLKRLLADAMLDNAALKDLLGKKW